MRDNNNINCSCGGFYWVCSSKSTLEISERLVVFCDCNRYAISITYALHFLFEIPSVLMFTFQNNGEGVGPCCFFSD